MKGPGNRVKFVIRRVWECPHCQRRIVTQGNVAQQSCSCQNAGLADNPTWMRLVKEAQRTGRRDVPT